MKDEVSTETVIFDMICHVAFDKYPPTRAEREKARCFILKYEEQTRKILETLLDKYAELR